MTEGVPPAPWQDIQAYLRANYAVEDMNPDFSKIVFTIDGSRSRIAFLGDLITLKNSMPLANMDINELVRPMELVTLTADALRRTLTGADTF